MGEAFQADAVRHGVPRVEQHAIEVEIDLEMGRKDLGQRLALFSRSNHGRALALNAV